MLLRLMALAVIDGELAPPRLSGETQSTNAFSWSTELNLCMRGQGRGHGVFL